MLRLFWLLAFGIAWLITLPPALAQMGLIVRSPYPWQVGILIGLAPAIAAVVASAREARASNFLRLVLRPRGPLVVHLLAVALPILALGAAFSVNQEIAVQADWSLALFALLWLVLGLGEEIGWRGFALPRLVDRYGFWTGSIILGAVWCIWHFPRLLGSPFLSSFEQAAPLIGAFAVQIMLANVILCWLYYRNRHTVWASTFFHATMNTVATAYFLAATDWVVTAVFAFVVVAIALAREPTRSSGAPDSDGC